MTGNAECCGWASWGELAGIGDGRVRVDAWEQRNANAANAELVSVRSRDASNSGAAAPVMAAGRFSGRRARVRLAVSRWRLAERNKRG